MTTNLETQPQQKTRSGAGESPPEEAIPSLESLFAPHQIAMDPVARLTYEVDAGMDRGMPEGVFYPESMDDVQRMAAWATATGTPLVARGAGTGLAGGAVAEHGGMMVVFARMNRVLALDVATRTASIEVGVVNLAFDVLVREHGLYYPPDPSSGRSAVIGGNLGANAGGPHCFKYGVTTNYVQALDVVLADGRAVRLGARANDAPGYDLLGVMVGSEGTLGIATQAHVRLLRNAPGVKTLMVAFATEEAAGEAVSAVIAAGLVPATLEMMDQRIMRMIEAYAPVGLPIDAGAGLIVEVDGYPQSLDAQMAEIEAILQQHGGFDLRTAQSEAERAQIWYGRKSAAGAVSRLAPAFYLVDVTVPRSKLAPMLAGVNRICDQYALAVGHVFHAGDGNLHPIIPFDPRDTDHRDRVLAACKEIVALCLEYEGSITGEHGVGIEKRAYMPMMYGGSELSAMLDLKRLFDPDTLLNPGKIFPADLPAPVYAEPAPLAQDSDRLAPATAEEAAALLAALTRHGRAARIVGQGEHLDTADAESTQTENTETENKAVPVRLSTHRLAGIHRLAPQDLYVTVGAGTRLAELHTALAPHNMTVPFLSPWPESTLGGILSTNLNSPSRLRYGSLRDNVMAMTVALADGRILRLGRPVVKNVAGYDLVKLFIGAQGTLGLIVDATLKLIPQPRARRTYRLLAPDVETGLAWAKATARYWFVTSGVVLAPVDGSETADDAASTASESGGYMLSITLSGLAADMETEADELAQALAAVDAPEWTQANGDTDAPDAPDADGAWAAFLNPVQADGSTDAGSMWVRVGVPSLRLGPFWADLPPSARTGVEWCFDVGNHLGYARISGTPRQQLERLAAIREATSCVDGYAVVIGLPGAGRGADHDADHEAGLDRWGIVPDGLDLMQGLKQMWDPKGILNPGDHPAG